MRNFLFSTLQMTTSCSVSLGCNKPNEACLASSRLSMKGKCVHQIMCPGQGNPVAPSLAATGYNCQNPTGSAPVRAANFPFTQEGPPHLLQEAALDWQG